MENVVPVYALSTNRRQWYFTVTYLFVLRASRAPGGLHKVGFTRLTGVNGSFRHSNFFRCNAASVLHLRQVTGNCRRDVCNLSASPSSRRAVGHPITHAVTPNNDRRWSKNAYGQVDFRRKLATRLFDFMAFRGSRRLVGHVPEAVVA